MRALIAGVALLVSSGAAAEEPEVEAHLEEAAAAAVALERVLAERQPSVELPCPEGDCGPGRRNRHQAVPEREALREDADGGAAGRGMGGMQTGGMGKMMDKMGGMHGSKAKAAAEGQMPGPSPSTASHVAAESEPSPQIDDPDELASDQDASKP